MRRPARQRAPRRRAGDDFRSYLVAVNPETPNLDRIAAVLRTGYDYVVIGAHARNAYIEPRATRDLDIIIADAQLDAFVAAVREAIPSVRVRRAAETPGFAALVRGSRRLVDAGTPSLHPLYAEVLANEAGKRAIPALGQARVASREGLIALKMLAALSPTRRFPKKLQDQADAGLIAEPPGLDRRRLARLLSFVPGGAELFGAIEKATREGPPAGTAEAPPPLD